MKLSSLILASSLVISPMIFAQTPPPSMPASANANAMHREKHPEMIRALQALRVAKRNLEHAAHDFNGHRAAALNHTNEAIAEVEAGLKSDQH